jgi:hypothetical protein
VKPNIEKIKHIKLKVNTIQDNCEGISMDDNIKEVEETLIKKGYTCYGKTTYAGKSSPYDPILYQKKLEHLDLGSRFLNVWKWDLQEFGGISYEVNTHFETESGPWVELKFYSIRPDKILALLDGYEKLIANAFYDFKGIFQT